MIYISVLHSDTLENVVDRVKTSERSSRETLIMMYVICILSFQVRFHSNEICKWMVNK